MLLCCEGRCLVLVHHRRGAVAAAVVNVGTVSAPDATDLSAFWPQKLTNKHCGGILFFSQRFNIHCNTRCRTLCACGWVCVALTSICSDFLLKGVRQVSLTLTNSSRGVDVRQDVPVAVGISCSESVSGFTNWCF